MSRRKRVYGDQAPKEDRKILTLKDLEECNKFFRNSGIERNHVKVTIAPHYVKLEYDMNKFLNKLSVWFFISQIVEIDFSHCDTFKDIKKELIKFIAKCENLRHLNLDYCNKNVEDVMTIIKVAANFQFLEELSLKEDFDHHQLVQLRNNEKEIFQLLRNKLLSNIKFRLWKREKDELRDFRYLFKLIGKNCF